MDCPFCGKVMQQGDVLADARYRLRWLPDNPYNKTTMDKLMADPIYLQAASGQKAALFWIPGSYCTDCRKLIIDTDMKP